MRLRAWHRGEPTVSHRGACLNRGRSAQTKGEDPAFFNIVAFRVEVHFRVLKGFLVPRSVFHCTEKRVRGYVTSRGSAAVIGAVVVMDLANAWITASTWKNGRSLNVELFARSSAFGQSASPTTTATSDRSSPGPAPSG